MSRYAVLADIHGNLPALDAVIADGEARGCTAFVHLGDCLSGPLWPSETADRMMALGWPGVAGNHERQLLAPHEQMGRSDRFARDRLGPAHLAWIAALPPTRGIEGGFLCHGTPANDDQHFLFTVEPDGLHDATPAEIAARAGPHPEPLIFCGHTHLPRSVLIADGRRIINPGSVGLQAFVDDTPHRYVVEAGDPCARYAVVEGDTVELVATAYDHERAAAKAHAEGFGDWAHALRTGSTA